MQKVIIIILIVVVAAGGIFLWNMSRKLTMIDFCQEVCLKQNGSDLVGNSKDPFLLSLLKTASDACLLTCSEKYGMTSKEYNTWKEVFGKNK